ncbi:MAG TPA: methylated-DNA--[protein]-cysteine S-methyltransferase [Polyangia bacterium]|nr:methylated-DNA--[protein]-cysteine S-methyltransferase [Polyangia bacterium]
MFPAFPTPKEILELDLPSDEESQRSAMQFPHRTGLCGFDVPTPYGTFGLAASAFGVSMVFFPRYEGRDVHDRMHRHGTLAWADWGQGRAIGAGIELMEYLVRERRKFETPVDVSFCTPFAQSVYRALTGVSCGETITYGELAKLAGHPGKARAVGSVLRSNPCPIFVPCHRVLSASGELGGWSGPPGWKEGLLRLEGVLPRPAAAEQTRATEFVSVP